MQSFQTKFSNQTTAISKYFKKMIFKSNSIHPDQWISSFLALIISNSKYQGEMLAFICPIGCKHPFTPHAMTKFPQEDEVFSICDINGDRVSLSGRRKILLHLMMIPFSIFKINRTRNFFDNGTLLSRFYSQSLREFRTQAKGAGSMDLGVSL